MADDDDLENNERDEKSEKSEGFEILKHPLRVIMHSAYKAHTECVCALVCG